MNDQLTEKIIEDKKNPAGEKELVKRNSAGKTTIAPEVLITIARLTTLDVPGVSRMSNIPSGVNRFLNRRYGEGVRLDISNDSVSVDLFVILKNDVNIRDVSRIVQFEVARAISEMVGMRVGRVNIHIEDIDYPQISTTEK
ncbi:MAG: Asp23/Gls24 family envelope stress response protein [Anaerolineales bacterium]